MVFLDLLEFFFFPAENIACGKNIFQNLNFKVRVIFEYIVKKYLHNITFIVSKNDFTRNYGAFKITLVHCTEKLCRIFLTDFDNIFFSNEYLNAFDFENISKKNNFALFQKL